MGAELGIIVELAGGVFVGVGVWFDDLVCGDEGGVLGDAGRGLAMAGSALLGVAGVSALRFHVGGVAGSHAAASTLGFKFDSDAR